jgi:hypothetical protein
VIGALVMRALLIAVGVGDMGRPDPTDTVGYAYVWEVAKGTFVKGYGHRRAEIVRQVGRREKFLELFNLRSGPRLFDFNFSGNAKEGTTPFADHFHFDSSGWGGDPFPSAQFGMSKNKVYDLRVNWRQTYYYWDRNDNALLPSGLHGLTSNQNWATVRRFGSSASTISRRNGSVAMMKLPIGTMRRRK